MSMTRRVRLAIVLTLITGAACAPATVNQATDAQTIRALGTDWQRAKWGRLARWYLRFSERWAALFCHALISDSKEVMSYYRQNFGVASTCIVYGVREHTSERRDVLNRFGLSEQFLGETDRAGEKPHVGRGVAFLDQTADRLQGDVAQRFAVPQQTNDFAVQALQAGSQRRSSFPVRVCSRI